MPSIATGSRKRVHAAAGSSSQAAIELLDDDEDSNDNNSEQDSRKLPKGAKSASRSNGALQSTVGPSRRASERTQPTKVNKPTRPTPSLGPGRGASSASAAAAAAAARRRGTEPSSSDSDAYVVVAASRAPSAVPAGTSKRSSRQDSAQNEPRSKRRRDDRDSNGKGKEKVKAKEKEPKRRKEVVTIEEGSEDELDFDENQTQPGPSKPSFKDRLSQNMHSSPRFSKTFKSKVKSSNSTSMPLNDDRFDSDEDEGDGYESAEKPSPRKKRMPKPNTQQRRLAGNSRSRNRNASDAENDPSRLGSEVERVSIRSSTDDEATAPAARRNMRSSAEELSDLPEPLAAAVPSHSHTEQRRKSLDRLSASRKEKNRKGHKKEKQKQRVVDSPEASPAPAPARASQPSSRRAVVLDDEEEEDSGNAELPTISPKARQTTSKPLFISDHEDDEDDSAVELLAGTALTRERGQGNASQRGENPGKSRHRDKGDKRGRERTERDASSGSSAPRGKKKAKKATSKARMVASSSSASSSSSAGDDSESESDSDSRPDATLSRPTERHEAESEEDVDEELENLKMDYNHVQAEKLRPKDDAKERRLDKLRAARAAKHQREERRKKGIVESDDEQPKPGSSQQAPQRVDSSSSEDDSDIDSVIPNLDDDDKDFIVQDGTSWEVEKTKVAKHLPPEIRFGSRDLQEHFETFTNYLVYKYIFANKSWVDESDEFRFALLALEKEINGTINSGIASGIWKEEFRAALDARPELSMRHIEYTNGCEGCNKHDRIASQEATISGPTYDRDTFEDDSDDEEVPQVFQLGRFCAEKCVLAHDLKHFQYRTHNRIHEICAEVCRLPVKIPGDREERDRVRGQEARRIIKVLGTGNFPEVKQMWAELDQALQRARRGLQ